MSVDKNRLVAKDEKAHLMRFEPIERDMLTNQDTNT